MKGSRAWRETTPHLTGSKRSKRIYLWLWVCVFPAERSHSGGSTKGERLSAKMKSLPVSNEPYESRAPKELGEPSPFPLVSPHPDLRSSGPRCRRVLRGPAGASDGATEDGSQEAGGGWRIWGWSAGRRPAARVEGNMTELFTQVLFGYFKGIVCHHFCALNLNICIYIPCL